MDALIHSATGAFIGWALPQRREGPNSAPLVITGALLPDVDILIEPFLHPQSGFVHRGFTHSLLGVAVLAPLAALVALLLFRAKGYARLVALIAIGMLSHVLLDLPTPMGTKFFYPFSNNYVHLDLLGYLDWTLNMAFRGGPFSACH
jgi:inner membrane protein